MTPQSLASFLKYHLSPANYEWLDKQGHIIQNIEIEDTSCDQNRVWLIADGRRFQLWITEVGNENNPTTKSMDLRDNVDINAAESGRGPNDSRSGT